MKLVDFAKERGIDPRTIHKYMERYPEIRNDCKKDGKSLIMGDYALRELDKVYPLPKPVVIINGKSPEEYEEVLEELVASQKEVSMLKDMMMKMQKELSDQNLLLAEKEHGMLLLEERKTHTEEKNKALEAEKADLKAQNEELQEKLRKLENRSFFERIFNKGV